MINERDSAGWQRLCGVGQDSQERPAGREEEKVLSHPPPELEEKKRKTETVKSRN